MKTLEIKRYEEHLVIMEQGVDFEEKDIVDDALFPGLYGLPSKTLTKIAKSHGFDEWSWMGHLETQDERKIIKAKFRNYN